MAVEQRHQHALLDRLELAHVPEHILALEGVEHGEGGRAGGREP